MGRPFQLVIFDCDGVLVDSERLAVRLEVQVHAELGWPLTESEIIDRFLGRTDAFWRSEVEARLGRPLPEGFEASVRERFRQLCKAQLRAVPGIVEALEKIALPTCVASSGSHDKMQLTLGLVGLHDRFRGRIFSATEVAQGKPAPDLFLHAARTLGVSPRDCAVVEDSPFGVAAARAAGMFAFGFSGGLTSAERLTGADTVVFSAMEDLPALLQRGRPG